MQEGFGSGIEASGAALAAFIGYLLVVSGIGIAAAKFSSAGVSEFFVAGRGLNRFVVALSAVVSGRSAWLLLGVTGMAYTRGANAVWTVVGYTVAEMLLFLFYAPRLRRFSERYDCITLPDFFSARFGDRDGRLRLVLGAVILMFMVSYVSAQFVAGGKAIGASFGLSPTAGILLTAGIVLVYTVLGGFLAVSLTDAVQGVLMIIALVVLPVLAYQSAGGLDAVLADLATLDPFLVDPLALTFGVFLGSVGIGLGSPGQPHILVRYMAINDAEQLRYAAVVGTVWNVVMGWGAVFLGLAGRSFFPDVSMLPAGDTENLYPLIASQFLHPALFGVVVASIFAAIMSTADSQLLVAASTVVRDVYEKVLKRDEAVPPQRLVMLSRVVVALLVVTALGLGVIAENLVFWLVLFAWAGLGAAIGPPSVMALFWRGTTRAGVLAGLVVGTLTTFVWYYTPSLKAALYELIPAVILGTLATYVVSRLTTPPDDVDEMFAAMERTPRG